MYWWPPTQAWPASLLSKFRVLTSHKSAEMFTVADITGNSFCPGIEGKLKQHSLNYCPRYFIPDQTSNLAGKRTKSKQPGTYASPLHVLLWSGGIWIFGEAEILMICGRQAHCIFPYVIPFQSPYIKQGRYADLKITLTLCRSKKEWEQKVDGCN